MGKRTGGMEAGCGVEAKTVTCRSILTDKEAVWCPGRAAMSLALTKTDHVPIQIWASGEVSCIARCTLRSLLAPTSPAGFALADDDHLPFSDVVSSRCW